MNSEPLKRYISKYTSKEDVIFFTLVLFVTLFSLFSLLRANILYIDDIGRAFHGYGWGGDGRPLATGIMRLLSGNAFILDLSPATQIIAAGGMSIAAFILVRELLNGNRGVVPFLGALLVSINPYFLQVYSYRYDSLPYAMGLLLAVLAVLLLTRNLGVDPGKPKIVSELRGVLVPTALLFGSLCLYQPTSNVFFISVAGLILIKTQSHNIDSETLRAARTIVIRSVVTAALALGLYGVKIKYFVVLYWYAQEKSEFDFSTVYTTVFVNLISTWELVWGDWHESLLGIGFIVAALCAIARLGYEIIFCVRTATAKSLPRHSYLWLLFFQLGGVATIGLFATIGILLVSSDPLLHPRGFAGFGAAFAVLLAYGIAPIHATLGGARKVMSNVILFMPIVWLIGFALAYGNAAVFQDRYNKTVANFIVNDTIALTGGDLRASVAFFGSPGFAPAIRGDLITNYPLLSRLVIVYPNDSWNWGYDFISLMGLDISINESRHCYGLDRTDAEVLKNSGFYKVSRQQDCLIYEFR